VAVLVVALLGPLGPRPAPASADPQTAPTLAMIGDSIPFQGLFHFDKTIQRDRRIVFSGTGLAYKIRTVLPDVRQALRNPETRPDIFLAFIGTSESQHDPPSVWRTELRQLMDLVSPRVDCVRVFEIDDDRTGYYLDHDRWAREYNRITHTIVSQYANAEWFHYEQWAGLAGRNFERPDTLHHNTQGQIRIAWLMRSVVNSCDPAFTTGPFWDVPDAFPAAEAIRWVGEQGLFDGFANGTYRAKVGSFVIRATRAQLLNMAWRLAGSPRGYGPHPWTDSRRTLDPVLRWAYATHVGSGFPDGTYRPDQVVTRGQAVQLLWRMAGRPTGYPDDPWADADGAAFRWTAATRVLGGVSADRFGTSTPLTRAQAATILHRFDRLPEEPA
jgi:hypothetical protein